MTAASDGAAAHRPRVVLLGASNLTRGISTVVETAQRVWRQPIDMLTALGYGRSYGLETTVLGRTLPGILDCALWDALPGVSRTPLAALVTDVGNDLMYGVEVRQIVAWLEAVVDRLQQAGARVTMTLLPLVSVRELSPGRFRLMRQLLFPSCRLNLGQLLPMAEQLHDQLWELGKRRDIRLIDHRAAWYGFDPIHIRLRQRASAWREILAGWREAGVTPLQPARGSLRRWMYLRTRAPHCRRLFGRQRRCEQPAARLPDGTTVSFY